MQYNPKYYDGTHLILANSGIKSIRIFKLSSGYILGMFQGSRGSHQHLDFIIKYLAPGLKSQIRTPSHTHWIVDLVIKSQFEKEEVKKLVIYFLGFYNRAVPFNSKKDRQNYKLKALTYVKRRFSSLDNLPHYRLDYLAILIELFILCEKRNNGAFMFKNLLSLLQDYCDGKKDFFQLISHSKRV